MLLFYCDQLDEFMVFEGRREDGTGVWRLSETSALRPYSITVMEINRPNDPGDPLNYDWELVGVI